MIDIAHAAVDNDAELPLPMPDGRGNATEIGAEIDALLHDHVAWLGEIMRLDLAQARDAGFDLVGDRRIAGDVAHGERPADQPRRGIARREQCRGHGADNAEFVHRIRGNASEIRQSATIQHVIR